MPITSSLEQNAPIAQNSSFEHNPSLSHRWMPRILALLALLAWFSILSLYPSTMFMAGCIACMTLPFYRWLRARLSKVAAIVWFCSTLAMVLIIPLGIISAMVAPQAVAGIRSLDRWRASGWSISPELTARIDSVQEWIMGVPLLNTWFTELSDNFNALYSSTIRSVLSGSLNFAGGAVTGMWLLFLFFIITTLGVVYAPMLHKVTLRVTQLPEDSLDRFLHAIRSAVRSVVLGIILVSSIQGVLCGIGYKIMGISEPAFWGLLSGFAAVIPVFGTALLWVPLALSLWISGSTGAAIGMVFWGMVIVAGSDNLVRPYFLQTGIQASMVVLLVAILCSMAVFGPLGLMLGPVVVAFGIQAMRESDILAKRYRV